MCCLLWFLGFRVLDLHALWPRLLLNPLVLNPLRLMLLVVSCVAFIPSSLLSSWLAPLCHLQLVWQRWMYCMRPSRAYPCHCTLGELHHLQPSPNVVPVHTVVCVCMLVCLYGVLCSVPFNQCRCCHLPCQRSVDQKTPGQDRTLLCSAVRAIGAGRDTRNVTRVLPGSWLG